MLATGALVVGIPPLIVILVSFFATLLVLLAGMRLFGLTRRMPRRRAVAETSASGDAPAVVMPLPKPRYVIDEDDDEDEDDF